MTQVSQLVPLAGIKGIFTLMSGLAWRMLLIMYRTAMHTFLRLWYLGERMSLLPSLNYVFLYMLVYKLIFLERGHCSKGWIYLKYVPHLILKLSSVSKTLLQIFFTHKNIKWKIKGRNLWVEDELSFCPRSLYVCLCTSIRRYLTFHTKLLTVSCMVGKGLGMCGFIMGEVSYFAFLDLNFL